MMVPKVFRQQFIGAAAATAIIQTLAKISCDGAVEASSRTCQTLVKLVLSGNHLDHVGPSHIGTGGGGGSCLAFRVESFSFRV